MKNPIFIHFAFSLLSLLVFATTADAQCTNPGGCIYGDTTVTINYGTNRVQGYSIAQADYTAGLNFNPHIRGSIYRTDNPETDLDYRTSTGNGSSLAAVINLSTSNFVNGKTYCNYTNYFAIRRSTGQTSFIGWMQDCKAVVITPPATPTPTPTPTPQCFSDDSCQTPTPTPTPGPTPSLVVTEVGFTGDREIRIWPQSPELYVDRPDGSTPTWKRTNNPKYPVAYQKGSNLNLFAKFTVSPSQSNSRPAQIRIKRGSTLVTQNPVSVSVIGSELNVPNIIIPFSNIENAGEFIRVREYELKWEVSFNNGSSWQTMNGESKHEIHWINSGNPPDESQFKPFKNHEGTEFQGLYDVALKWSTGQVQSNEQDIKKVIQKINAAVERRILYNPAVSPVAGDTTPLAILEGANNRNAVCWDNALILLGLLKSIGIESVQEKFHWGGQESSGKRNYYCPPGGCTSPTQNEPLGRRITMQTKRGQLGCTTPSECLPANPSFTYHANVEYDGRQFDPSYGLEESNVELLTAAEFRANGQHRCVSGRAATEFRVTRNVFGFNSIASNNDTGITCQPQLSSLHAKTRYFRFDDRSGADIALYEGSTGKTIIRNSLDEVTELPSLEYDPLTDVLAYADYDGDGLTDPAVWYGSGAFYYRMSSLYYKVNPLNWHPRSFDEKPVPGDYDGDGRSDIASWRASDGKWTIRRSSDALEYEFSWGSPEDIPVTGDYDGDGKTDIAIWRPSNGQWWIRKSSDSSTVVISWGMEGDIAVAGDYDGDGTTDYAVVRPSTGVWYILESENDYEVRIEQGPVLSAGVLPIPADFNGDNKTDIAAWFSSAGIWHIVDSQTGDVGLEQFGSSNDLPIMAASVLK